MRWCSGTCCWLHSGTCGSSGDKGTAGYVRRQACVSGCRRQACVWGASRKLADRKGYEGTGGGARAIKTLADRQGCEGTGDYASEQLHSLAKAAQDKAAVSRSGVFGSLAPRFTPKGEADAAALPAPGSYQPREPSPPRHRGDAAVFQSKTQRFRAASAPVAALQVRHNTIIGREDPPHGDPANLGPGCYSPPDLWSSQRRHPGFKSTAFGSEARRSTGSAATLTPGPGRYKQDVDINKAFRPYTNPAKEVRQWRCCWLRMGVP